MQWCSWAERIHHYQYLHLGLVIAIMV